MMEHDADEEHMEAHLPVIRTIGMQTEIVLVSLLSQYSFNTNKYDSHDIVEK